METVTPKLRLQNVQKTFRDKKGALTPVLEDVTFDVQDQ